MKYTERFQHNYYQDAEGLEPERLFMRMSKDDLIRATARRNDEIQSRLCQGIDDSGRSNEIILFEANIEKS